MIAGVITAAGSSSRISGEKKEYRTLQGKPLLVQSVLPFLDLPDCTLMITVPPGDRKRVAALLTPWLGQNQILIEGGQSRQESVFLALQALESLHPEYVLIHDGARPWIRCELIHRVLRETQRHGACIPVTEITEAPKYVDSRNFIQENLVRSRIRTAQTPQGFRFESILRAHRAAWQEACHHIDDAEIYSKHIGPVYTVPGDPRNRKVTYREDLEQ
jgi:2-C-methyl-D-erythritol 4-phosphate cytidylyltransferase/2-C-methyl-D-erythritol 4-phosphate cytidylyltransferase/2-C-methyl-D-erythritol 2,4-cyclodiphosphate synthase